MKFAGKFDAEMLPVERPVEHDDLLVPCLVNSLHNSIADFRVWQGAATSHSGAMGRSRNAARRKKTRRIRQVIYGTGH